MLGRFLTSLVSSLTSVGARGTNLNWWEFIRSKERKTCTKEFAHFVSTSVFVLRRKGTHKTKEHLSKRMATVYGGGKSSNKIALCAALIVFFFS